ncbi:MAG TPA: F0F1 ATP synthase subunit epsilon [Pyrinomonadaceae bacterium]|nr:F0F1 ATP synthase subunit epsilon [Pyrinomonadaceae bacterium]
MLKLEIVTPEKRVLDAEVDSVTVPTVSGEAGILPNHASLVSALKPGILSYTQKGGGDKFAVSGGFVEVSGGTVSVLVDTAESADEIDVDAAKVARETAEKALAAAGQASVEENESTREALDHAQTRIHLASSR